MIDLNLAIEITHEKNEDKLASYFKSYAFNPNEDASFRAFQYLLQVRTFFLGVTCLSHRQLAEIVDKIEYGADLLSDHLKKIDIGQAFYTIVKALHLLISRTDNRGDLPPAGFKKNILHISDLHFGDKFKYTKNKANPRDPISRCVNELLRDVESYFDGKVDFVVVSGDLTCSGTKEEFNLALVFLNKLSKALRTPVSKFLLVPGNHDIRWRAGGTEKFEEETESEHNFKEFSKEFFDSNPLDFLSQVVFDESIVLLGFNSIRIEPDLHGIGYVGEDQVDYMFDLCKSHQNKIKIACAHHHILPVNTIEPFDPDKDFSLMIDAKLFTDKLLENNVSIYIHGHMHTPFYSSLRRIARDHEVQNINQDSELLVFSAGSLSVSPKKIDYFGRNHYNFYTLTNQYIDVYSRFTPDAGHGFAKHLFFREWLD